MTVVIEPMRWWDVADVADLERAVFPRDPWTVEQFWQELALDTRAYWIARTDDVIVGYAGIFALSPDSDLQTIAVGSTAQGTGVGTALLERAVVEARDRGSTQMMLEVRADNDRAFGLYRRHGFERIGLRPRYYSDGGDALIMRCRLGTRT